MSHFFTIILFCVISTESQSLEKIRDFFEWGEYPSLIEQLEPLVIITPQQTDSHTLATYFSYLGVAYYGIGRIDDSKKAFTKAFSFDAQVMLDSNYITHEIGLLFSTANTEFISHQKETHHNDSLLQETQKVFESSISFENSISIVQPEANKRGSHSSITLAVSFFSISAIFGGLIAYEYFTTKNSYREFQINAQQGDKVNYDKNKNIVNRANNLITTCSIAAGTSIVCGIVFSLNITHHKNSVEKQQ